MINKINKNQNVILSGCTLNSVILSACEGTMDSSAKAFRMTMESGRSMVEMLGVLAIIGVLSVGGIAGYTMAMNKHKANEILQAASVRAVMIKAQLAQGKQASALTLAEFGNEKVQGVAFESEYTDGGETFNLKLTWDANVDKTSICTQMNNIIGDNPTIDEGCTTLTYKTGVENITIQCPTGFAGSNCDRCADGYTGDNCNTCASGFDLLESGECCSPEKTAWDHYIKGQYCCKENEYVIEGAMGSICCSNPTDVAVTDWDTYDPICCPAGKYSENPMDPKYDVCCAENEYVMTAQNDSALHVCCPNRTDIAFADLDNYKMKCCPSTSTGLVNGECN